MSDETRASGSTPAEEGAHAANASLDDGLDETTVGADVDREHRTPRFLRMRFNWHDAEEMRVVSLAHQAVESLIVREFTDAYRILAEIQEVVRIPVQDRDGNQVVNEHGEFVWERTPGGRIIEDYTRLTRKQMESYLGQITTRLFAWEQTAERMWMDAMFARSQYEERYAISYDGLRGNESRTTVDDRKQFAASESAEERYFAIYRTSASRRAQAVVRSMERIGQRLKDLLVAQ